MKSPGSASEPRLSRKVRRMEPARTEPMLLWVKKAQGSAGLVAGLIGHPDGRRAGQEIRPPALCTLRR